MTRDELKKHFYGPIATLPTAFDDEFEVDLGVMAEMARWSVANGLGKGIAPLKVCAAMGEGPDLVHDEWPHVLRTVVNAAGSGISVICGLSPKDTLHTIEDAKKAQDLGAVGLQIDLPMFHHPNQDDMVRHFTQISDAIDIGIMVYNTHWFGVDSLTAETVLRMSDAEHVTAIKWAVPAGMDYDDMRQFSHVFNVIDNSGQPVRAHKNGAKGYIDPTVVMYPAHALKVWELAEAEKYDEAQVLFDSVSVPFRQYSAKTKIRSGGYRQTKGLMTIMGLHAGPPRPPTLPLDEDELAELREIVRGFGWPVKA